MKSRGRNCLRWLTPQSILAGRWRYCLQITFLMPCFRGKVKLVKGRPTYEHPLSHLRTKYSLNALSHDTAIGLIRKVLEDGVNLKEVSSVMTGYIPITVCKSHDVFYQACMTQSLCTMYYMYSPFSPTVINKSIVKLLGIYFIIP